MRKLSFAVVALLALGCGGKKKEAVQLDCAAPVDHAMSLSADDFKKSNIDAATIPKIRDVSVTRCKEDKWSNEVLKCLADAKASQDVIACQNKMTRPQQESLAKAIGAETGTGSEDTGSDGSDKGSAESGSAGSGSAESGSGSADSGSGSAGSGSAESGSSGSGSGSGSGSAGSN